MLRKFGWSKGVFMIVIALCGISLCMVVAPSGYRSQQTGQDPMGGLMRPGDMVQASPRYGMADLSLRVREQVDFLLTPALLVQDAITDGVILTYPEE